MRHCFALARVLISAQLCLGMLASLIVGVDQPAHNGKAFITQAGAVAATHDSELAFGENWDSVRTFRLLRPLDRPLRVYINERPSNPALYKSHYNDYVEHAFALWSKALDGRLSHVIVNNPKLADVTFGWVPGFDDHYVAGVTTYSIGHASVEIKTVNIPDKDIEGNIIHELGHALGIAGHSQNGGDIMVGVRKWHRNTDAYEPTLSSRDVQAIRRLYSTAWHQGEDLYSVAAQTTSPAAPVIAMPLALDSHTANADAGINRTLLGSNRLNVTGAGTTVAIPLKPPYIKVFPVARP